jgi:hypothetical protein
MLSTRSLNAGRRDARRKSGKGPDMSGRLFRSRNGLAREITAVLLIKAALLLVLWRLFFAQAPVIGAGGVADALLGASAGPAPQVVERRQVSP